MNQEEEMEHSQINDKRHQKKGTEFTDKMEAKDTSL